MMKKNMREIGFKKNADKIFFILATGYLIFAGTWITKTKVINANPSVNIDKSNEVNNNEPSQKPLTTDNGMERQQNNPQNQQQSNLIPPTFINPPALNAVNINPINNQNLIPLPLLSLPKIQQVGQNSLSQQLQQPLKIPSPPSPPSATSIPAITSSKTIPQKKSPSVKPVKVPIPPPPKISKTNKLNSVPILTNYNDNSNNETNNNNDNENEINVASEKSPKIAFYQPLPTVNSHNTLVGLINLDNQVDIALFKINDLTERVKVGQEIGASGWILVSIQNQQIIINRDGKTMRLQVGQTF